MSSEKVPLIRPSTGSVQDREVVPHSSDLDLPGPTKIAMPLLFALIAALGPLGFGYIMGFTSPAGTAMQDDLKMSDEQLAVFGSFATIGAMEGAALGGFLMDRLGRRGTIAFACVPAMVGFLMISFAHSVIMAHCGRVFTGLAVGLTSVSVPVFIAEIAPPALRGGMGAIFQLAITVGILIVYAIGIPITSWRTLAWVGAVPFGGLLVACLAVLPQSAPMLLAKGDETGARRVLVRLRGTQFVDAELAAIRTAHETALKTGKASFFDCFRGSSRRAMIVGAMLMVYQQFSGINVVIFYAKSIFEDAGQDNANLSSVILAIVQVVVTVIACLVIDKAGRRALLMFAGIGIAGSCLVLGYFFYRKDHGGNPSGAIALVAVISYITFFSSGLGAIPWLMMAEIFPAKVRGMAVSLITLFNWILAFIVTSIFPHMVDLMHESGTFWFYGAVCLLGVGYVMFFVPETKGKTLEQIEAWFAGENTGESAGGANSGANLVKFAGGLVFLVSGILVAVMSL